MSLFKQISVTTFYVTDWERAKEFYNRVLGWPVAWADDEIGWIEWGAPEATHIAINRRDEPGPLPVGTGCTAVLAVDDAHAVTKALRAQGVRCEDVVEIPNVVTYGTFYDPDGNRIQFANG